MTGEIFRLDEVVEAELVVAHFFLHRLENREAVSLEAEKAIMLLGHELSNTADVYYDRGFLLWTLPCNYLGFLWPLPMSPLSKSIRQK